MYPAAVVAGLAPDRPSDGGVRIATSARAAKIRDSVAQFRYEAASPGRSRFSEIA